LNDPFSELLKQNKDREFFEDHMSETGQYLDLNGLGGKAQYVKAIIDNN